MGLLFAAMAELEKDMPWLINLTCQAHALSLVLKDLYKESPMYKRVVDAAKEICQLFNNSNVALAMLHSQQREVYNATRNIRAYPEHRFAFHVQMLEDIRDNSKALKALVLDEDFITKFPPSKATAQALYMHVGNPCSNFFAELDCVLTLGVPLQKAIHVVESNRPMVSQLIPLWNAIQSAVDEWDGNYSTYADTCSGQLKTLVEQRFKSNYHKAWALATLVDPLYFHASPDNQPGVPGFWVPNTNLVTTDQLLDAERLVRELADPDKRSAAQMEFMELRVHGLPEHYMEAMKETVVTEKGVELVVTLQRRRLVWELEYAKSKFPNLRHIALRVLALHATSCAPERNWSKWRWVYRENRARLEVERAEKMIFLATHAALKNKRERDSVEEDLWEQQLVLAAASEADLVELDT